ncbi:hypothetical protein BV25DRAFT_1820627 [Artomyces pyxidatus]|uniref:Uncharacterized protein n=1 Tax=Artomyces pyxidatus TaxID=48021 RepID=A0ACB8TDV8_9AGAM|nr:hypothetical protein BV25DRAFT_1820627 [Artomyces pyxidatus]
MRPPTTTLMLRSWVAFCPVSSKSTHDTTDLFIFQVHLGHITEGFVSPQKDASAERTALRRSSAGWATSLPAKNSRAELPITFDARHENHHRFTVSDPSLHLG